MLFKRGVCVILGYITLGIVVVFLCFRFGDWKNWKLYYPTVLFYIIGDLTAMILTFKKPLWLLKDFFWSQILGDYFIAFVVFPYIIILFLSKYPKKIIKRIIYICIYVLILSCIEYLAYRTGHIIYLNGWNILWNILFYFIMFPLLWFHYKKPLWAWSIAMALAFIVLYIFKIPLDIIK